MKKEINNNQVTDSNQKKIEDLMVLNEGTKIKKSMKKDIRILSLPTWRFIK